MALAKFTVADVQAAEAEGWKLEHVYDAKGYWTYIVTSITPNEISPTDWFAKIWERAKKRDGLCIRALAVINEAETNGRLQTAPRKKKK